MEKNDGQCQFPAYERPGELMIDPYAREIGGEDVPVILCEEHEQEAFDAI